LSIEIVKPSSGTNPEKELDEPNYYMNKSTKQKGSSSPRKMQKLDDSDVQTNKSD